MKRKCDSDNTDNAFSAVNSATVKQTVQVVWRDSLSSVTVKNSNVDQV